MTKDQGAMDPDDLDFTDDERVMEIDEDRYVVSPDGPPTPKGVELDGANSTDDGARDPSNSPESMTQAEISKWLASSFQDSGFTYGFDATLAVENEVVRHRLVSNDLPTTFETLLAWFVRNTTTNSRPEEALGILLSACDLPVRYPPRTLEEVVESHGLSVDDPIADLLDEVDGQDDGLRLPPRPE